MCVIAAKPSGVKMPSVSAIENMWYKNPDGAGFMYAFNGKVYIEKGFMKLNDFEDALERIQQKIDLKDIPVVMHFRIATHGGVIPANTHPFPVSSSMSMLQKLKCNTSLGVAHNGIIEITPRKGVSDTMEYVASQLAPLYKGVPEFYLNPHLMEMVDNAVQSKLAFLTKDGEIYTVGKFETEDDIMYSNSSYKPYEFKGSYWRDIWKDYDIYEDVPSNYKYIGDRLLRWFDFDEDVTCVDSKGRLIDNYEYDLAVDSDGKLYRYDYNIDGFVEMKGGRAYTSGGKLMYAEADDNKFVTMEPIYDYLPTVCIPTNTLKGKKK